MGNVINQGFAGDIRSLDQLRQMGVASKTTDAASASDGQQKALEAAAKQFESIFTQMWMRSMRETNQAMQDEDSPFNSRDTQFYQGMLDDQIAVNSSKGGAGSLAELIVKQLSPKKASATQHHQEMAGQAAPGSTTSASGPVPTGVLAAEQFVSRLKFDKSLLQASGHSSVTGTVDASVADLSASSAEQSRQDSFVRQLLPAAKMVASKMGLSPVALIAQAALETGWGKHVMNSGTGGSSNNLFGIKASGNWQGASTTANSQEYVQGSPVMQRSSFRSYTNVVQSMQDYANLITGTDRYEKARAVAQNPEAYFEELQAAGYATDPNYAAKLKSVLHSDAIQSVRQQMTDI